MSYKPPIELFYNDDPLQDIASKIVKETYDRIVCEVKMQCGVNIDKDELLKALKYDRDQYNKGYQDAMNEVRVTGKWICTFHSTFPQYEPDEYRCSICNGIGGKSDKFCKHCGAKMNKEENKK